jgi:hypothetical protein
LHFIALRSKYPGQAHAILHDAVSMLCPQHLFKRLPAALVCRIQSPRFCVAAVGIQCAVHVFKQPLEGLGEVNALSAFRGMYTYTYAGQQSLMIMVQGFT